MLLLKHIDGLFVYAMALTRNSFEAEDFVQETYVRALAATGRLRENGNVKAWLYAILRNVWLNQVRQQRAAPYLEIACLLDCPPGTGMSRFSSARCKLGTLLSSTNKFSEHQKIVPRS